MFILGFSFLYVLSVFWTVPGVMLVCAAECEEQDADCSSHYGHRRQWGFSTVSLSQPGSNRHF